MARTARQWSECNLWIIFLNAFSESKCNVDTFIWGFLQQSNEPQRWGQTFVWPHIWQAAPHLSRWPVFSFPHSYGVAPHSNIWQDRRTQWALFPSSLRKQIFRRCLFVETEAFRRNSVASTEFFMKGTSQGQVLTSSCSMRSIWEELRPETPASHEGSPTTEPIPSSSLNKRRLAAKGELERNWPRKQE